jgi:hypothetical protein
LPPEDLVSRQDRRHRQQHALSSPTGLTTTSLPKPGQRDIMIL